ncbi:Sialic acid-binding periplasmic protein SiaP precursor (plasmid) [Sulfitobacter sp. THAF37]|uniref:TRAP transporter substrate-binding protein n=1 Tax=Sulfitobacter sp. THAF37 TaxID=2587855 RepID=UPI0012A84046|nr:TRAP transporter substrate-binding protein [Sulfitobacter sp. THAF37]QFT61096.1 Sialic acid-binding periplasmic protein SiaP precursor [Sulfitobacter sp. THAF37]
MKIQSRNLLRGLAIGTCAVMTASVAFAAEYTMKFSISDTEITEEHFTHTPLRAFEKEIEEKSDGRIDVQIYWSGQLGKTDSVVNMVSNGLVEAIMGADGFASPYDQNIQVLGIPYLFNDREAAYEVLDGQCGKMLTESLLEKSGLRAAVWHENGGYRNYSANKPLTSVEDLQGLKIRTMNNPVHMEIVNSLGASPTPIPWQDLYTALQTGVVDGQENSLAIFRIPKLEEVQKHIIMDGHVYSPGALYFSKTWWDSLPEDLQEIVQTASENFRDLNREISAKSETADRAYLEEQGVSIYDPTAEQKQQFRELTQGPALEYIKENVDAEILSCFLDAAEAANAKSGS